MNLSKSTLGMVADTLERSKRMLRQAEQQIEKCRAGLAGIADVTNKSKSIIRHYQHRYRYK